MSDTIANDRMVVVFDTTKVQVARFINAEECNFLVKNTPCITLQ